MLDVLHLPRLQVGDVQIFDRPSTVTNTQWMTWLKPRGAIMVMMFVVGGGTGGGGGFTGIAGAARGGGGGGAGSATTKVMIPAGLLPDQLYIQVGAGTVGLNSGGGTAASGIPSLVSIAPNTQITNILAHSSNSAPTGGITGTGAAGGGTSTGGTPATLANMPLAALGTLESFNGQGGAAGGAQTGAIGGAQTIPSTGILAGGGSGGAGVTAGDFAGGAFTAVANSWLSEQRPAIPAAGSFNGSGGVQLWKPFFSFGGGGGSSSNAGVGGNGGNGAFGAGGGGGGGGTTGGRGGDGGSGIVIITTW